MFSGTGAPSGHTAGMADRVRFHEEQASRIRRYIIWRNNHAYDERLRQIVARANVA